MRATISPSATLKSTLVEDAEPAEALPDARAGEALPRHQAVEAPRSQSITSAAPVTEPK